jgi:exodeoxyribonuclease V beta subunit
LRSLVEKGLETSGYEREWLPHITSMVNSVVSTPLSAPEGAFTLGGLRKGSWIPELEFFFPLKFITSDLLSGYLRPWMGRDGAADLSRISSGLRFKPVQGMVRGFMDMVFEQGGRYYLLDWKSNHLGYRVEDYGQQAMRSAMEHNLYPLQYLLYTVALNRYLSLRIRDYHYATHFGGVLYVFLRGASPERGEEFGFFRDTPSLEMVDALTRGLIDAGG